MRLLPDPIFHPIPKRPVAGAEPEAARRLAEHGIVQASPPGVTVQGRRSWRPGLARGDPATASPLGPRPEPCYCAEMRALQLLADRDLRLMDIEPPPPPGPGEVQIAMRAVALNHIDVWGWRGMAFAKR
ncbi:MAG: NADPH:quinone oxidoreductase, partial [Rubritepida sp.]|nr:NADPH:quinone oxidoreductase [Rubritepida sp.]